MTGRRAKFGFEQASVCLRARSPLGGDRVTRGEERVRERSQRLNRRFPMTMNEEINGENRVACGIFDAQGAPPMELIDECVHCGFCLPACPTYQLWGEEMDSPRGRIYLMKLGREGHACWSSAYVAHFDRCLGCMACITACPSGVRYDRLIEATRAQIERHYRRTLSDRLFRRLLFETFPYPRRLRWLAVPLWFYRASGLRALLRASGLMGLLPARLRAMEELLPPLRFGDAFARTAEVVPALGQRRARVGLLLGCVQRIFFSETNRATARVLAAEGCEVVAPVEQGCCGALLVHAGREREARAFARRLIDLFERAAVDAIIVNAAGCGSNVKEYAWLLRDDPEYANRAQRFAAKCRDLSEFLVELGPRATRHALPLRVAYHDACHLRHAQGIADAPRALLAQIPELELAEIPEGTVCCGSAGIYNLVEPHTAQRLGERKARNVLATGAQIVVASNPGCILQIGSSLQALGQRLPVVHLADVLDASLRKDGGLFRERAC